MKLKLRVTEKNIREGVRHSCAGCPLALALKAAYLRQYPRHRKDVIVRSHVGLVLSVTLHRGQPVGPIISRYSTHIKTRRVQEFIHGFDYGREVKACQITVDLVKEKNPI